MGACFFPPPLHEHGEPFRFRGREVVHLGKVVLGVVELPHVVGVVVALGVERDGLPAVVPDGAAAVHLEVLSLLRRGRGRGLQGRRHARAFERHLLDTAHRFGRGDAEQFEHRGRDVAHVVVLAAHCACVFAEAGRPAHDQRIAHTARVGGALVALQRRVGRHGPTRGVLRACGRAADLVEARPGDAVDPELDVWLHFDAKYSVDGVIGVDAVITDDPPDVVAKRADVLKMHAYRDAIRRSAGAYVLYPGSGAPQHRKEHHEILPGIGAFPLRPNEHGQINGLTSVTEFLREVLDHAANQASAAERSQFWQAMHARASGRRVAPSSGLMLPPADERVLVGFVRGDQREWVRRTRQYNVRADERRGAVRITDDMITARLLVLWAGRVDGRGELIGVFERTGPWQVASADDLHAQGYPVREAAARYLVASINTVSPSAEAVLASRVSNFSVAERSAPHSLTWAALMSLQ